jgi:hypothetical protein
LTRTLFRTGAGMIWCITASSLAIALWQSLDD